MPQLDPFRCAATADRSEVMMVRGAWRHRIKADDLPKWVSLYRTLRDREGGRFAAFHNQPLDAIEALAAKLGMDVAPKAVRKRK